MTATANKLNSIGVSPDERENVEAKVVAFDSQPELASAIYRRIHGDVLMLPAPSGKLREITPDIAAQIRERMHEKALEVAEEMGVQVSFVMTEFNKNKALQQDVTVKFSGLSSLGHDRFALTLIRDGRKHKVPPEIYGLEFIKNQTEYVITGLDTSGKAPLLRLKDAKGQKLADAKEVLKYLKKQDLL